MSPEFSLRSVAAQSMRDRRDDSQDTVDAAAHAQQPLHVAYLINQYPKVSHTFIRREILALERQGVHVERFAQRGWDADVVDEVDVSEKERTRYLLVDGFLALLVSLVRMIATNPGGLLRAARQLVSVVRRSNKMFLYHFAYLAQACRLVPWLMEKKVSHLHAHFGTNSAEIAMYVRLLGGPSYSFTVHGPDEFDQGGALALDTKISHASFVAAISSYTRSQLFRLADGADWGKIKIVHCGLDQAFYSGETVSVPDHETVLCVGRFNEQKGHLILLEAFARAAEKHENCRLVLAGDGEMRNELEASIMRLGIKDKVRITGWISTQEVRDEMCRSRALIMSSFQEGLPVVIMEAMALRRPVISTYVAGIPELIQHGRTGWLVAPGHVSQLAEALDACLRAPVSDLQDMGRAAHERVIGRHDIDREAARLADYFRAPHSSTAIEEWQP